MHEPDTHTVSHTIVTYSPYQGNFATASRATLQQPPGQLCNSLQGKRKALPLPYTACLRRPSRGMVGAMPCACPGPLTSAPLRQYLTLALPRLRPRLFGNAWRFPLFGNAWRLPARLRPRLFGNTWRLPCPAYVRASSAIPGACPAPLTSAPLRQCLALALADKDREPAIFRTQVRVLYPRVAV